MPSTSPAWTRKSTCENFPALLRALHLEQHLALGLGAAAGELVVDVAPHHEGDELVLAGVG